MVEAVRVRDGAPPSGSTSSKSDTGVEVPTPMLPDELILIFSELAV